MENITKKRKKKTLHFAPTDTTLKSVVLELFYTDVEQSASIEKDNVYDNSQFSHIFLLSLSHARLYIKHVLWAE